MLFDAPYTGDARGLPFFFGMLSVRSLSRIWRSSL
jgi:hypothetical protein